MRGLAEQLEHNKLSFRELVALKERLLIGKYIVRDSREVKVGFYRGAIRFGDLAYQVQKELLPRRKAKCAFHWFPLFLAPFFAMVPYYLYYKPPYYLCQVLWNPHMFRRLLYPYPCRRDASAHARYVSGPCSQRSLSSGDSASRPCVF